MSDSFWLTLGVGTAVIALAVSSLAGCSGGGSGGTGGGSGGGSADAGQNCAAYCAAIQANCTGPNAQYETNDRCENACATFAAGAASDQAGNTLGCRIYHAGAAHSDPATHCVHAGPGGAGTCGDDCDGYCQLAQAYCTAANNAFVYPDLPSCQAHCHSLGHTVKFSVAEDAGTRDRAQVACVLYHAQESTTNPAEHCSDDLANDGGPSTVTCALP